MKENIRDIILIILGMNCLVATGWASNENFPQHGWSVFEALITANGLIIGIVLVVACLVNLGKRNGVTF